MITFSWEIIAVSKKPKHYCLTALFITIQLFSEAQVVVWEEHFSGSTLNPQNWVYDIGDGCDRGICGWGNAELQYYTSSTDNVRLENGSLVIEARREILGGKDFTSGRIKTMDRVHFKYGTLEARIKVPDLKNGLWPAFWTLGVVGLWPASGEIDIMELGAAASYPDNVNNWVSAAAHWEHLGGQADYGLTYQSPNPLTDDYHVYKLVWTPDTINVFIDNIEYYEIVIRAGAEADLEEFHSFHYILLNLAVGGIYTGKTTPEEITAPMPAQMLVDYIKLIQGPGDEIFFLSNVNTGTISPTAMCSGSAINVPYSTNGIFNAGNIFTAQLSDAAGSFAAPLKIGSTVSTTSGTINATIPTSIAVGAGYRIRVVSSNPVLPGNDNGSNITINSIPPIPAISTGGQLIFCQGGNVNLTSNASAGNQWYKNGVVINTATGKTFTATESGIYTVVVTNTDGCSSTSAGVTVNVNSPPLASIAAAGPTTFCVGKNVLLKATVGAGYTYQWKKAGINIDSATLSTYIAKATGSYSVMVTNAGGCSTTTAVINVTVNTLPLATVVAGGPLTFCSNKSVLLKAITGSGYIYQWKKNGVRLDGQTLSNYTATVTGIYSVEVTNASGCSTISSSFNVVVHPLPIATITPNGPLTFCSGKNVILRANTGPGYTYQWKRGGAIIQGATSFTYSATTPGYYIVIVTNVAGCSATSAASSVVVNPLPVATITPAGPTTFCNGKNVLLKANTGTNYTYQWKKAGVNITENATQANYTASVSGLYSVIVTNVFGCSATSAAITLTVNSAPPATIVAAGPQTFCAGKKVLLKATVGTGYTYQWKRAGANLPGQTSSTYTADITGIYTAVVTNAAGCATTSNTINVNVNPAPLATITHDDPLTFPQGGSVVLKAFKGTGYTYQWKKDGANLIGQTSDNYKATLSGNYAVVVTNSNICQATSQPVQVSVTPGRPITKTLSDDEDLIKVYPNPLYRNDYLKIDWGITAAEKGVLVTVSDIAGRKINSQLLTASDKTVRIPGASGVYIVEFRWGINKRKIFRVIKIE